MTTLIQEYEALIWHGLIIFFRVGAMVSLAPAFGEQSLPLRVKLVAAICFSLIVAPTVASDLEPPGFSRLAWLALTETLTGLALGIGLRMFILALQTAGSIMAQSTSLSQILGGAAADPVPAMGYILVIGAVALAMLSGLHVQLAKLLILSYDLFPIGDLLTASALTTWGLAQVTRAFALAFTLAAPFVILSVLYNLALGAINKAMPQLMVAFVGAPVITAGGLFLLFLAAPIILGTWLAEFQGFISDPLRITP